MRDVRILKSAVQVILRLPCKQLHSAGMVTLLIAALFNADLSSPNLGINEGFNLRNHDLITALFMLIQSKAGIHLFHIVRLL